MFFGFAPVASYAEGWFDLPLGTEEISGAAPTDYDGVAVLVSDEVNNYVYVADLSQRDVDVEAIQFAFRGADEISDLEGVTRSPYGPYYMTASFSRRNSDGEVTARRVRLGRFTIRQGEKGLEIPDVKVRGEIEGRFSLRQGILDRLPKGVSKAASESLVADGGLNVEALAYVEAKDNPFGKNALLFGFRGPLAGSLEASADPCKVEGGDDPLQGRALYIYLLNPDEYLDNAAVEPEFSPVCELNLRGQAFRDATMVQTARGPRLLVISGSLGRGGHSHAFLVNLAEPGSEPEPVRVKEDSDFPGTVEGAAVVPFADGDYLVLFEDLDAGKSSRVLISKIPWAR